MVRVLVGSKGWRAWKSRSMSPWTSPTMTMGRSSGASANGTDGARVRADGLELGPVGPPVHLHQLFELLAAEGSSRGIGAAARAASENPEGIPLVRRPCPPDMSVAVPPAGSRICRHIRE